MNSHNSEFQRICLEVEADQISGFIKLIERGFRLKVQTGQSIRDLFCGQFGISDDYFDNRIQTIFLNGKAVDNPDAAWVENGSRLALSAAMPGLVGATFRKGGRYASLRGTISYAKSKKASARGQGKITLKLFNMIAKELGPVFLQKGIIIEGKRLQDFVIRNSQDLKAACTSIHLNDAEIDADKLKKMRWEDQEVFVQVRSEKES